MLMVVEPPSAWLGVTYPDCPEPRVSRLWAALADQIRSGGHWATHGAPGDAEGAKERFVLHDRLDGLPDRDVHASSRAGLDDGEQGDGAL